ncbi:MAG: hypothetical protein ACOCQD_04605 [archaeon]
MDEMLKRNQEMASLLSEVILDTEEYDGMITPPTYMKIKRFFEEENIPEVMQDKVKEWEEFHGKISQDFMG